MAMAFTLATFNNVASVKNSGYYRYTFNNWKHSRTETQYDVIGSQPEKKRHLMEFLSQICPSWRLSYKPTPVSPCSPAAREP